VVHRTKIKNPVAEMIDILEQVRRLVSQTDDSPWSTRTLSSVLRTLDKQLACLVSKGRVRWWGRRKLESLFAPTGDLQEVSIAGGWGDEFLALSARFDAALKRL
jgi:hypothetical protein